MWKSPSPVAFPMAPLRPPSMKVQCLGKKTYRQHRFSNGVLSGTREGCFFKCHLFKPPYLDLVDAVQLVHTAIRRRSKVQIFVVTVSRIEGADNRGRGGGVGRDPCSEMQGKRFLHCSLLFPVRGEIFGRSLGNIWEFSGCRVFAGIAIFINSTEKEKKTKVPFVHSNCSRNSVYSTAELFLLSTLFL